MFRLLVISFFLVSRAALSADQVINVYVSPFGFGLGDTASNLVMARHLQKLFPTAQVNLIIPNAEVALKLHRLLPEYNEDTFGPGKRVQIVDKLTIYATGHRWPNEPSIEVPRGAVVISFSFPMDHSNIPDLPDNMKSASPRAILFSEYGYFYQPGGMPRTRITTDLLDPRHLPDPGRAISSLRRLQAFPEAVAEIRRSNSIDSVLALLINSSGRSQPQEKSAPEAVADSRFGQTEARSRKSALLQCISRLLGR